MRVPQCPAQGPLYWRSRHHLLSTAQSRRLLRPVHSKEFRSAARQVPLPLIFRAFALIKPDAYLNIGRILSIVESSGFTLGNLKMFRFGPQEA